MFPPILFFQSFFSFFSDAPLPVEGKSGRHQGRAPEVCTSLINIACQARPLVCDKPSQARPYPRKKKARPARLVPEGASLDGLVGPMCQYTCTAVQLEKHEKNNFIIEDFEIITVTLLFYVIIIS